MSFTLKNHTISYGDINILNDINLEVKEGEKIALLGSSGSGKSTLLKNLYSIKKENTSYIPQELSLVDNLSVFHNIYIALLDTNSTFYNIRNLIKPVKKEIENVKRILLDLGLEEKIFTKVKELSGGQKQRTAIACSLNTHAKILLADEPISALDERLSGISVNCMKKKFDTIICALHNVEVALQNFDRVVGLSNGNIVLDKKSSDITALDTKTLYDVCK